LDESWGSYFCPPWLERTFQEQTTLCCAVALHEPNGGHMSNQPVHATQQTDKSSPNKPQYPEKGCSKVAWSVQRAPPSFLAIIVRCNLRVIGRGFLSGCQAAAALRRVIVAMFLFPACLSSHR
jgi:hypothetical protein